MWELPRPGMELCLLHWQADSLPLSHQGSPPISLNMFHQGSFSPPPLPHDSFLSYFLSPFSSVCASWVAGCKPLRSFILQWKQLSNTNFPLVNAVCCCFFAKSCLTLATPWTGAHLAPLLMGYSRQEYWSGLPFPSQGDLSDLGIEPGSPALAAAKLVQSCPTP